MEATQSAELIRSQIFYNYCGGIGLLFAGIGGIVAFLQWGNINVDKYKRKNLGEELKARYPPEKNGKSFQLIQSNTQPGKIYLLDTEMNIKHHIASWATFQELGYDFSMVKTIDKKQFDSIETGRIFLTEGAKST